MDFAAAGEGALELLQDRLGFALWVLSRRDGERYVVLHARDDVYGINDGDVVAWSDTFCARMVDGLGPNLAPDVAEVAVYRDAPISKQAKVGAYVGVPVTLDDGTVFGTLCGIDPERRDRDPADLALVSGVAALLGAVLSAELQLDAAARRAERAESESLGDPLTGLGNRLAWDRAVASEEARCRRYGHAAAVLAIDIDGLKSINDRDGHDAGDAMLRRVGAVIASVGRPNDAGARMGGDEFGMLLVECDHASAVGVRDRLVAALHAHGVSASVGLAARPDGGTLADALRLADADMYRTRAGRAGPAPVVPLASGPVVALATAPASRIDDLLDEARRHLGTDVAFVGEFAGGQRVFRYIRATGGLAEKLLGTGQPLEDTVCQRIIDGVAPAVIADAQRDPSVSDLAITKDLGVGVHLGVPLELPDGRFYGTVCSVSFSPDPTVNDRDLDFLRMIARLIGAELARGQDEAAARHQRVVAIDAVLDAGGPTIVVQPIVELATGRPAGYEALSRFPRQPWPTPDRWFAEAAAAGLDGDLELSAVRAAVAMLPRLPHDAFLAVNVSPAGLCAPAVQAALLAGDPSRTVVELTEHARAEDPSGLRDALRVVRQRGVRLAVDDTGTGYSALQRVLELRPELIKLDQSLVIGLAADSAREALALSLCAFAAHLGATVVAEGIEGEADLAVLRHLGVALGQGYLLGRPAPAETLVMT